MRLLFILFITIAIAFAVNSDIPQEGLKAEMQKRWDDAVDVYTDVLKKNPQRSDLYLRISDIHVSQKRLTEAGDILEKGIQVDPKQTLFYKKLSEVYAVQNKPKEAYKAIESAVKLEPKNIDFHIAKAKLANWNNQPLDAIDSLKTVLAINPDNKQARLLLARSYEWSGLPQEALKYYTEHLKKNPNDLQARLDLANIQEFYGDIKSANVTLLEGFKGLPDAKRSSRTTHKSVPVEVPILLYHCIDKTPQNSYWIGTDEFDAQMQTLRKNDYTSVSMKDVYGYANYDTVLPDKPVVISFDDGCRNLYTQAYPILKKYGMTAEIYLITDAVGDLESERLDSSAPDEASKLGETGGTSVTEYLIWPEIKEMSDNGIVFGSHSKSHPLMSELDDENLSYQLLYSKLAITANTGANVTSFAYPFGDGSAKKEIHQKLKEFGYETAVAAEGGIMETKDVDFVNIPRISIYGPHNTLDPHSKGVSVVLDPTRPADLFMAKLEPSEAERQFELCNRYTAMDEDEKALIAIDKAVELEPNNLRYLITRLFTAGAAERSDIALDSALRAYKLDPDNDDNLLRLAQTSVWANNLDDAAKYYERYNERHPDIKEGYLEYAQTESWRGAYASAEQILKRYKDKFSEDDQYLEVKVGNLIWGGRQTEAFSILKPKLQKEPEHYNANFMNTVALYKDRQMVESLVSLEKTESIAPDSKDNLFLRKYITTDFRPSVRAGGEYYIDSDEISILSGEVEGKYYFTPLTSMNALWHTDYLKSGGNLQSLYGQDNGDSTALHNSLTLGIEHRFSSDILANVYVGTAKAETHTDLVYGVGLSYFPIDQLTIDLNYDHHYFTVTPRTVGRGTMDDSTLLHLYWEPTYSMYVDFSMGYDALSDDYYDNNRWSMEFSPKWVVSRTQYWNFDLGLSASAYGYDKESNLYDLGYYAPELYQAYYLVGLTTWKISDDDSVNLAVNAGMFKDNNMDLYKFGGGIHLEGVFGLYRDWMLKVSLGEDYSARYYNEAYTATSASLYITRRF